MCRWSWRIECWPHSTRAEGRCVNGNFRTYGSCRPPRRPECVDGLGELSPSSRPAICIEPTRNLFLKTEAKKTRKSKFENRQKQHDRPAFFVQDGNSHLFLETKKSRKSTFENRQKQHNLLAFLFSKQKLAFAPGD